MMTSGGRAADARRVRRGPAQWLLGLLLALAIGASVAMVFSPSRSIVASLAVIAALWAAVIGAILVTKFRRQADSAESKARDLRLVYELQLEREITARRQYELGVEAQIRKEVRAESNEELRELKAQLAALRSSLELLVGELPEQRVALHGERRRELEHPRTSPLDDGAVAEADFATTAPDERPTPIPVSEPHTLTEVLPVVTADVQDGGSHPSDVAQFVDDAPTDEWAAAARSAQPMPAPAQPAPARPTPARPTPVEPAPVQPTPAAPVPPAPVTQPGPNASEVQAPATPASPGVDPTHNRGRHGRGAPVASPDTAATVVAHAAAAPAPAEVTEDEPVAEATAAWETSATSRGRDRHRAPDTEPGAHANGRSVSELIDQFRSATPGGRRRRNDS